MMLRGKLRRRLFLIVTNSISGLLVPLLNPVVSYLVVRLASIDMWGEFVSLMLVVQLGAHIAGWGNKDYLLREFSLNPARLAANWQTSLFTRLMLLLPAVPIALLTLPVPRAILVLIWTLALVLDQSFDVLIQYRKDFAYSIGVEVAGLGLLAISIFASGAAIDVDRLIALFSGVNLIKPAAYFIRYRRYLVTRSDRRPGHIEWRYFSLAFSFFLLGLTGLLQSRIDLYTVSAFLSKAELGQYQVFMTFMLYLQSISNFVVGPFVKNIYRLNYRATLSIATKLFVLGALVLLPGLAFVQVVLRVHYRIDLPMMFIVAGGLMAWPIYFYLPTIYALYKAGWQASVVKVNGLGIGVSLITSLILLPRVGMIGAVIGAALAQWMMLAAYMIYYRTLREDHALIVPELS
jgi:O-antigen/teichoic acid export membrane protein